MEAIWKIEVENFPAFILVDNKGNDFFKQIQQRLLGLQVEIRLSIEIINMFHDGLWVGRFATRFFRLHH